MIGVYWATFAGRIVQDDTYVIPTKDFRGRDLPLERIAQNVSHFLVFAEANPEHDFVVTPIAHWMPEQIAPMFETVPDNVRLPEEFTAVLKLRKNA